MNVLKEHRKLSKTDSALIRRWAETYFYITEK